MFPCVAQKKKPKKLPRAFSLLFTLPRLAGIRHSCPHRGAPLSPGTRTDLKSSSSNRTPRASKASRRRAPTRNRGKQFIGVWRSNAVAPSRGQRENPERSPHAQAAPRSGTGIRDPFRGASGGTNPNQIGTVIRNASIPARKAS